MDYKCYSWNKDDQEKIKTVDKRIVCETHPGFKFTKGDDELAPGCGTCWCCQPGNNFWTKEGLKTC